MWFTPLASLRDIAILDYAAVGGGTGPTEGLREGVREKNFVKL